VKADLLVLTHDDRTPFAASFMASSNEKADNLVGSSIQKGIVKRCRCTVTKWIIIGTATHHGKKAKDVAFAEIVTTDGHIDTISSTMR
jgi:hypothetical protein